MAINCPSDAELLDAVDRYFEMEKMKAKARQLRVHRPPLSKGALFNPFLNVGNCGGEGCIRVALWVWAERRGLIRPDATRTDSVGTGVEPPPDVGGAKSE